jgi:predicted aldo/keto reductase-like oxidoreductase
MLYRKLGKTNESVSILGIGCMRLPILDGNMAKIDEEKATTMIRYAIDHGVNYLDTAWSYHSAVMGQKGESEPFAGRVLKDGYREKVKIATKLPAWLVYSRKDMEDFLDSQRERLQTESIDFYLIHSLGDAIWKRMKALGIDDFLEKAIADGKIRYAGFSFHDNPDLFREIVDAYDWSFCQIQYNLLDENYQAGKAGMQYAANKGLGIIAMEPLRGGKLAKGVPDEMMETYKNVHPDRTPAQWALKWVWNHPEIGIVLSGMNCLDDVIRNLEASEGSFPESLRPEEMTALNKVKSLYGNKIKVNCTTCSYCMPCPSGVNIPGNFGYYNDYFMFSSKGAREATVKLYNIFINPDNRPQACTECGQCEEKCPQGISIIEELKNTGKTFGFLP